MKVENFDLLVLALVRDCEESNGETKQKVHSLFNRVVSEKFCKANLKRYEHFVSIDRDSLPNWKFEGAKGVEKTMLADWVMGIGWGVVPIWYEDQKTLCEKFGINYTEKVQSNFFLLVADYFIELKEHFFKYSEVF